MSFKVGDRVESTHIDALGTIGVPPADERLPPNSVWVAWDSRPSTAYRTSSLRLVPPPPDEFYSGEPGDLPLELPAGTRWKVNQHAEDKKSRYEFELLEPAQFRSGQYTHTGRYARIWPTREEFDGSATEELIIYASQVLWSTVPKRPKQPVPTPTGSVESATREGAVGGAGNDAAVFGSTQPPQSGQPQPPDPYAGYDLNAWAIPGSPKSPRAARAPQCRECGQETTKLGFDGEPQCTDCQCMVATAILGHGPANEPLDRRISAARPREEAGKGSVSPWDSEDADELFATHGSGR